MFLTKLFTWLAKIEEVFFTNQMEWMAMIGGLYDSNVKSRREANSTERERRRLWEGVFTVSDWSDEEWADVREAQVENYDVYANSIDIISQMLSELNFTPDEIKGFIAALTTRPDATTPERQARFIRNWFYLTKQLPGMSDSSINSAKEGRVIETTAESLRTQIRVEVMKWIIPESSGELRNDLIELTYCNNQSESDANLMTACNVKTIDECEDSSVNKVLDRLPPLVTQSPKNNNSLYKEINEVVKTKGIPLLV
uniref:ORF95 n=1 Tax=Malaco herpesvirus 1 TaxID=3031797 RepID=A0AA48SFH2_9VIRU|nr:TPA_asm: ORF95 [Malaco herpesvirus 1]